MMPIDTILIFWVISLGIFVSSATIQVIGFDQNINPELSEVFGKLSHIGNTIGVILLAIGLISLIV